MAQILIIYASIDGHTKEICQRLKEVALAHSKYEISLLPVTEAAQIDLQTFDKIVIGASIRYGMHSPDIHAFIDKNVDTLDQKPNAFFSVNVVARKANKNSPKTNPYIRKFLKRISWRPKNLAVFAGKINYPIYGVLDRLIIRLIMLVTGGPTDPAAVVDFTDWKQVEEFGQFICEM